MSERKSHCILLTDRPSSSDSALAGLQNWYWRKASFVVESICQYLTCAERSSPQRVRVCGWLSDSDYAACPKVELHASSLPIPRAPSATSRNTTA